MQRRNFRWTFFHRAQVLGDFHRAVFGPAHGAEWSILEAFLRQGGVMLGARRFRVQRERKLPLPVEIEPGARQFIIRYFRVEPGGWTAIENHPHDHGIFILHGRARILLGEEEVEVGPRDAVYIAPHEVHQLTPIGDEPLGFLCIVPPKENEIG